MQKYKIFPKWKRLQTSGILWFVFGISWCPLRNNFIFLSIAFYRMGFHPLFDSESLHRENAAVTNSCLQWRPVLNDLFRSADCLHRCWLIREIASPWSIERFFREIRVFWSARLPSAEWPGRLAISLASGRVYQFLVWRFIPYALDVLHPCGTEIAMHTVLSSSKKVYRERPDIWGNSYFYTALP